MESENKKAVRVSLAILCVILGYVLNSGLVYLSNVSGVSNPKLLDIFALSTVVAVALALGTFLFLLMNQAVMLFSTEVVGEFKKVVWPGQRETALSTVVVIILVFVTAVLLWFFDWVWSSMIRFLIS